MKYFKTFESFTDESYKFVLNDKNFDNQIRRIELPIEGKIALSIEVHKDREEEAKKAFLDNDTTKPDMYRLRCQNYPPETGIYGKSTWFELDENSNFYNDANSYPGGFNFPNPKKYDELDIFYRLQEFMENLPSQYRANCKEVLSWPIFSRWFEHCKEKYRVKIIGRKYGLS
jgi:hypothetical protein